VRSIGAWTGLGWNRKVPSLEIGDGVATGEP
jgi:hypothetical protein